MARKPCRHLYATQVAKLLVANPMLGHGLYTKRIYWCDRCGALASTFKERGSPNRGEWTLPRRREDESIVLICDACGKRATAPKAEIDITDSGYTDRVCCECGGPMVIL